MQRRLVPAVGERTVRTVLIQSAQVLVDSVLIPRRDVKAVVDKDSAVWH